MVSILVAILVAILWAVGEVYMAKDSVSKNRRVIIFYQYLGMSILYFGTVLILSPSTFSTFSWSRFFRFMPAALANIIGMVFYTKAIKSGKLSVVSPVMAAYPIINVFRILYFKRRCWHDILFGSDLYYHCHRRHEFFTDERNIAGKST